MPVPGNGQALSASLNSEILTTNFWGHHGYAGVVVGNTIQVRLGALTIPLVAFWFKRVLGSRDCPQVGKVPCSFFNRPPTLLVGLYSLGKSYRRQVALWAGV